jgi:CheY-like chemotaxis protein
MPEPVRREEWAHHLPLRAFCVRSLRCDPGDGTEARGAKHDDQYPAAGRHPRGAAWLKLQIAEVFPDAVFFDASRVHAALKIIATTHIDVALIDLGLPDGSGVDAVAQLRESQPHAQAVVVTIHDDDDHLFPALQAGAFGYLLKDQAAPATVEQFRRMSQGEPPAVAGDRAAA